MPDIRSKVPIASAGLATAAASDAASDDAASARIVAAHIQPLVGGPSDFDALLELVGDARFVLLGEASHGTHEFYRIRAEITKRLIMEWGFAGVAVEADWPDAYRVNRFVRGESDDADASDATVSDSMGWISTACTHRWTPCCLTWRR